MRILLFILLSLLSTTTGIHEGILEEPQVMTIVEPQYRIVECTAYTSSEDECGKDDGITASGVKAVEGVTVAADDIPLGTRVLIDGHEYIVQDRFGGDYRNRIDIYHEDVSRAIEFGRRQKKIRILEE